MPPIQYTASELESLTPDEREAMQGDDSDAAYTAELAGETAESRAGEGPGADDKGADGKPTASTEEEGEKTAIEEDAPIDDRLFVAEAPADAAAQLEALKTAKTAARNEEREAHKKLMAGDMDEEAYDAIKTKTSDLKQAISEASLSERMTQQQMKKAWVAEVENAFKSGKAEGIDIGSDEALNLEFNAYLKANSELASKKGMTDVGLKASKWALEQAQKTMRAMHPELLKKADPKPGDTPKPGEAPKPANKAAAGVKPRHDLTTLGNLPNADRALDDSDDVAEIGMLEGEELERRMASMSKGDVEKMMAKVSPSFRR
jgi:hypothetical protein